jgi:hypothetical protein
MFSNTIKRSVATVGVLAGLLAAAGPASAGTSGDPIPTESVSFVKGPHQSVVVVVGEEDNVGIGIAPVKAPTNAGTQVGSEGVKAPRADDRPMEQMSFIRGDADNGHAGFCGVDVSADHIEGYVVTNNNDPDAMAIARGTQVGSEGVKAPTNAGTQFVKQFEDSCDR